MWGYCNAICYVLIRKVHVSLASTCNAKLALDCGRHTTRPYNTEGYFLCKLVITMSEFGSCQAIVQPHGTGVRRGYPGSLTTYS
jgi:hypothetical protein